MVRACLGLHTHRLTSVDPVDDSIIVGKRAASERTPEPDELAKRVKLTADLTN